MARHTALSAPSSSLVQSSLWTTAEVAKFLNVTTRHVRNLAAAERLTRIYVGRTRSKARTRAVRFDPAEVLAFVSRQGG